MNYETLLEKYNSLLAETERLRAENRRLKEERGRLRGSNEGGPPVSEQRGTPAEDREHFRTEQPPVDRQTVEKVHNRSDSASKIRLFMSLFWGREDVYARRWESKDGTKSGYSPVCLNLWKEKRCKKPQIPCSKCENKSHAPLDEKVFEAHLRGNIVAGVYPMLPDETCRFLAMDFDGQDWKKDITVVRRVCEELNIPLAVERSRSGRGGHIWFFFSEPLSAALARKFGTALLTRAMNRRHEIGFKSYDRLFPSQDTLPRGGLGNLIALPFQKAARRNGNSEFVDGRFEPHADQWAFLSAIEKLGEEKITTLVAELCDGQDLGVLKIDEEQIPKPWEKVKAPTDCLKKSDFPARVEIVRANMLFIPRAGISQKALNRLKRMASFKNPIFYKYQAMRLPTFGYPRVISCADETEEFLCLPRGCESDLLSEFEKAGVPVDVIDETNPGRNIDVEFKGRLRDEQAHALEMMLKSDIGILSGTTTFGKTVLAIRLIAERKVNTLILVDKIGLLSQWKEKLSQFLVINENPPELESESELAPVRKKRRKKKAGAVGQLGGGKNTLTGIVDIALMQSIGRRGEVKQFVRDHGMIIADECHHAPAFTYERILKSATAKYVYGLTATPTRKDGHHPILFMHCGPIRYRDDAKKQALRRPFDHYIVPRFTSMRIPVDADEKEVTIQRLYAEIVDSEFRNRQIVEDVLRNYQRGANCLALSLRTAHVGSLAKQLEEKIPDVIALTGGMGAKTTREVFKRIADTPGNKNLVLVATGHFIGEGFDEPRLDTLFLAMPISWKGTLQQYAGRLHRLYESKKEVKIYDYVDIHVPMLERMYQKRLKGYASMGYKTKGEDMAAASPDIIFEQNNFLPVFVNDIQNAEKEILIVSPFVRKRRTQDMIGHLESALEKKIRIIDITRPATDYYKESQAGVESTLDLLKTSGVSVVERPNIHQKFAVVDQKIVWYGSINLLSHGRAQESIMRIESRHIANELIKTMEKRPSGRQLVRGRLP